MLIDGGASVNLMPGSTCKKLGVQPEDLVKTNMVLSDFMGGPTEAKGVLMAELAVGSKVLLTTFFVVDAKGTVFYSEGTGSTPTVASRGPCTRSLSSGTTTT